MSAENREKSRRWFEKVWNERCPRSVEELLDPDSLGHTEGGDLRGLETFRQYQAQLLAAFPDLRFEVEGVVADGDEAVVRWHATGTHAGDGLGLDPSHRPISVRGITWHRYRDGKLVEAWDRWNQEAMLQALREGTEEQRARGLATRAGIAERMRAVRQELFGEHGGPEVARRLGIAARTYYNYETGVTIPAEILLAFLDLTGARPAWILRGEGPRYEDGRGPAAPA